MFKLGLCCVLCRDYVTYYVGIMLRIMSGLCCVLCRDYVVYYVRIMLCIMLGSCCVLCRDHVVYYVRIMLFIMSGLCCVLCWDHVVYYVGIMLNSNYMYMVIFFFKRHTCTTRSKRHTTWSCDHVVCLCIPHNAYHML